MLERVGLPVALAVSAAVLTAALVPAGAVVGGTAAPQPNIGRVIQNAAAGAECTAVLIAPQFVLTAASCLVAPGATAIAAAGTLAVNLGETAVAANRTSTTGEKFTVIAVQTPPVWTARDPLGSADLAVLQLNLPSKATPAQLGGPIPMSGQPLTVYGWGNTVDKPGPAQGAATLQSSAAVTAPPGTCTGGAGAFFCETATVPKSGACYGDAGAPVFNGKLVAGVLSSIDPATPPPAAGPSCLGQYRATLLSAETTFLTNATARTAQVLPALDADL